MKSITDYTESKKISYKKIYDAFKSEIDSFNPSLEELIPTLEISNAFSKIELLKFVKVLYGKVLMARICNLLKIAGPTYYTILKALGISYNKRSYRSKKVTPDSNIKTSIDRFVIINKSSIDKVLKFGESLVIVVKNGTEDYEDLIKNVSES